MCRLNPIIWCALLLVVAYAAENQSNSIYADKQQDDMVHYELHVNLTTRWDHDENSTRDDEDSVQHEFYSNYTKNLDEKGSQNVPAELRDNSTEINDGDNSTTSQLRPGSNSNETNSNICNDTVCIPICCELGYRMIRGICTPDDSEYDFPEVHEIGKKVDEVFPLFVSDPCTNGHYLLNSSLYPDDEYIIMTNGSVYQTLLNSFIDPTTYCFAVVMNKSKYELTMCFDTANTTVEEDVDFTGIIILDIGIFVSLPFLLLTFVVYTILPELWNMYGYILRGYIGSLFLAYILLVPFQMMSPDGLSDAVCIGSGKRILAERDVLRHLVDVWRIPLVTRKCEATGEKCEATGEKEVHHVFDLRVGLPLHPYYHLSHYGFRPRYIENFNQTGVWQREMLVRDGCCKGLVFFPTHEYHSYLQHLLVHFHGVGDRTAQEEHDSSAEKLGKQTSR
ncbi:uncharacterized protein LOC116841378 isoform X2 [Odontomachus brunneus]|uniref:uncharacterized protein LOC116841378 isoform X2 n=1 Tax=Odontomachus brunneus TaxID=486640 RepID=UPI0013F2A0C7|nr:uncharacterized protein LOC116841378 isoform X2 [Odontomachus brunneus]